MFTLQPALQRRLIFGLALAVFVAGLANALYWHLAAPVLPYDDAYITFRHVKHLLAGQGLTYNVGEPVFGSSTPLYTLWLAALGFIFRGSDLAALAVRANQVWYVASAVLLALFANQLTRSPTLACLLAALFAFNPLMLDISLGGMESFLFLALLLALLISLQRGRFRLGAALAGLALLARPEGMLLVAVWGLYWLWPRSRLPRSPSLGLRAFLAARDWPAVPVLGLIVLPWLIYAAAVYGTPIPHSVIAKSAPVYVLPAGAVLASLHALMEQWMGLSSLSTATWLPGGLVVWVVGSATFGLARCGPARRRGGLLLAGLFWLFVLFYSATRVMLFAWYVPSLWVMWLLIVSLGLPAFGGWLAAALRRRPLLRRSVIIIAAVLAMLSVAAMPLYVTLMLGRPGFTLPFAVPDRLRIQAYNQAAVWLNRHAASTDTVLAPEIGALGYYYEGYIYDACGLVSPQALPYLPVPPEERINGGVGAIGTRLARALQADYVVTLPVFSVLSTDRDPWFLANYERVAAIPLPKPVWDSNEVVIWSKNAARLAAQH